MIRLDDFIAEVNHQRCANGVVESCNFCAYDIDSQSGIANAVGFLPHVLSKADFLLHKKKFSEIVIIELTDLDSYKGTASEVLRKIKEYKADNPRPPKRELKSITNKLWDPIRSELRLKINGSIAVTERLYRRLGYSFDPTYAFIVICKNDNDVALFEPLMTIIRGQINNSFIIRSNKANDLIINKMGYTAPTQ